MKCKSVVKDVSARFDNVTTNMKLLSLEGVPIDLLTGVSELERLQKKLDLVGHFAEFKIRGEKVRVTVQQETTSFNEEQGISANKDFTKE